MWIERAVPLLTSPSARLRLSIKINDKYKPYKELLPALLAQQGPALIALSLVDEAAHRQRRAKERLALDADSGPSCLQGWQPWLRASTHHTDPPTTFFPCHHTTLVGTPLLTSPTWRFFDELVVVD